MTLKPILIFSILLFAATARSVAQATKINNDPDQDFKLAKEMYSKQQFSLAYPLFEQLSSMDGYRQSGFPVSAQVESKYYSIACHLQLNDETAVSDAKTFITSEHNEPRTQMMSYQLAEYYYRKKDFNNAISYYEKAGLDNLSNSDIAAMKFHEAYGYFTMKRFAEARPLFNDIRQIESDPNYIDANYYYGYIAFGEKKYKEALDAFKVVQDKPQYGSIVPYYVTEIYYFSGDREKAIESAQAALQKGNQYYALQLKQLLGHAFFEKKNFSKALPYLEEYVQSSEKVRREDLYELSFCYYEAKRWKDAITGFKELGGKQDSLAQNSMYLLGDAYLKTDQKQSARSAFLFCELNSSNAAQKEISQFLYARLSYELGYRDVALTELQNFNAAYPGSTYINEARELLVEVLANTNNYKDALTLIQSLPAQSEAAQRVYPRILYGRSVELINDQQTDEADALLNKIFTASYHEQQLQPALFWKGEIAYRKNKADSAVYYLENYMRNPVSYGEVNPQDARYILGYSYLKLDDYNNALRYFEGVTTTVSTASSNIQQDAYLRSADCYFMRKNYSKALQMYETVITLNLPSADYASYQKAVIAGAGNNTSEKLVLLRSFLQKYPSSVLVPDANMETANTYMANENFNGAIAPLNAILNNKNAVNYKPEALLKLGVCYFNLNNDDEALNRFTTLMSGYSSSDESNEAVEYVRSIFVSKQQPQQFVAFMRSNGKNVSTSEEDSLTYSSAFNRYNNKDIDAALQGLQTYLTQFPDGQYAVDAGYLTASIYNDKKDYKNALNYYTGVADKSPNKYAEQATLGAARINYFELKDYAKAEQFFTLLKTIGTSEDIRLESMRGLLRCQYKLSQYDASAVQNARDLLDEKGIAADDKTIAGMVIAKAAQANNQTSDALSAYNAVVATGKSEYAAEARYRIAEIYLAQSQYKQAEKAGFDVINKAGSYDYWITKAYILLGDVYFKQQDYFNAEATLQSVIKNATDEALKNEAQQKLDAVISEKEKYSKVEQQ